MLLFPKVFSRIWPTVVRDGTVCIQPPDSWLAPLENLSDHFKIITRQKALSHVPFAD